MNAKAWAADVVVCLPRDLLEEHTPSQTELVSAGHDLGAGLRRFSCPRTRLGLCAARERSLLCSGNDDEPGESVTSAPGPGLCEELREQKDVLLFKYQVVAAPRMTSTLLNDSGIRPGAAALTFAN